MKKITILLLLISSLFTSPILAQRKIDLSVQISADFAKPHFKINKDFFREQENFKFYKESGVGLKTRFSLRINEVLGYGARLGLNYKSFRFDFDEGYLGKDSIYISLDSDEFYSIGDYEFLRNTPSTDFIYWQISPLELQLFIIGDKLKFSAGLNIEQLLWVRQLYYYPSVSTNIITNESKAFLRKIVNKDMQFFNKTLFGINAGLQYKAGNQTSLEVLYHHSLSKIYNGNYYNVKWRVWSIGISYHF